MRKNIARVRLFKFGLCHCNFMTDVSTFVLKHLKVDIAFGRNEAIDFTVSLLYLDMKKKHRVCVLNGLILKTKYLLINYSPLKIFIACSDTEEGKPGNGRLLVLAGLFIKFHFCKT